MAKIKPKERYREQQRVQSLHNRAAKAFGPLKPELNKSGNPLKR